MSSTLLWICSLFLGNNYCFIFHFLHTTFGISWSLELRERFSHQILSSFCYNSLQAEYGLVIVWKSTIPAHSVKTLLFVSSTGTVQLQRTPGGNTVRSPLHPPHLKYFIAHLEYKFMLLKFAFLKMKWMGGTCPDSFYCSSTAPFYISLGMSIGPFPDKMMALHTVG